jgi:methionyl-tRNA synthetase
VADGFVREYREAMDRLALHEGALAAFRLIDAANAFIAESEPWVLARDPAQAARLSQVLYDVSEAVRLAAVLLLPVMPSSAAEILRRCGEPRPASALRLDQDGVWTTNRPRTLAKGPNMWPRLEGAREPATAAVAIRTETAVTDMPDWKPTAPAPEPAASASPAPRPAASAEPEQLTLEEFMRVHLRVAKVLTAERVPKSKKLVKLWIDLGSEQRTIVAGIADAYEPASLVGRTIVVVANLKPATLMGIESNGMVLAAADDTGRPMLLSVDGEPAAGAAVK